MWQFIQSVVWRDTYLACTTLAAHCGCEFKLLQLISMFSRIFPLIVSMFLVKTGGIWSVFTQHTWMVTS